ncbi:MAG: hypothetical protein QG635_1916 [Bacteroidota bacterium]|nr:hypothetical protein [Bacteroidota bacterium]
MKKLTYLLNIAAAAIVIMLLSGWQNKPGLKNDTQEIKIPPPEIRYEPKAITIHGIASCETDTFTLQTGSYLVTLRQRENDPASFAAYLSVDNSMGSSIDLTYKQGFTRAPSGWYIESFIYQIENSQELRFKVEAKKQWSVTFREFPLNADPASISNPIYGYGTSVSQVVKLKSGKASIDIYGNLQGKEFSLSLYNSSTGKLAVKSENVVKSLTLPEPPKGKTILFSGSFNVPADSNYVIAVKTDCNCAWEIRLKQ